MTVLGTETVLALCYAAFLVMAAGFLELVARHIHRRSEQASTVGFTYHRDLDFWECPDSRPLHREQADSSLKIIRYRAEARHCNSCVFKFRCTNSASGRVIEQRPDSWLGSGLYKFHRGISLALLTLAAMILFIELIRTQAALGQAVVSVLIVCVGVLALRLLRALRSAT